MAVAGERRQVLVDLLKIHLEVSLGRGPRQGFRRSLRGEARSLSTRVFLPTRDTELFPMHLRGLGGLGVQEANGLCSCNGEHLAGREIRKGKVEILPSATPLPYTPC